MTMLDPKGREAARLWAINATSDGGVPGDDYIDGILTAYLSTITPAEVGGLVDVTQPLDDLHVGSDGACDWSDIANAIDEVRRLHATALEAQAAELADLREQNTRMEATIVRTTARAERAEAQLTQARKALEPFAEIADTEDEVGREDHDDDRVWVVQAHGCRIGDLTIEHFRAARRALTGGKNG